MKCYLIERLGKFEYVMDFAMVVVAKDELHAERIARWKSSDFAKAKLKITEVSLEQEKVILVANTGA